MTTPSIYEPALLAAFINNVVTGWLLADLAITAAVAAVLTTVWARRSSTRPAPRHHRGTGRTPFHMPAGARPRPAQHCGRSAAADTALLPAIAPIYLGPPIETAQPMPQVVRR